MTRKSEGPKMSQGNVVKGEAYREAWVRIVEAQEAGFYLEAVAIEESIISDRLISFLARPTADNPLLPDRKGHWPLFGKLIERWQGEFPEGIAVPGHSDLTREVGEWKDRRNDVIHSLVKSDPAAAPVKVAAFLKQAKRCAAKGALLAKAVSQWHKKQLREAKRSERS